MELNKVDPGKILIQELIENVKGTSVLKRTPLGLNDVSKIKFVTEIDSRRINPLPKTQQSDATLHQVNLLPLAEKVNELPPPAQAEGLSINQAPQVAEMAAPEGILAAEASVAGTKAKEDASADLPIAPGTHGNTQIEETLLADDQGINPNALPFLFSPDRTPYILTAAHETMSQKLVPGNSALIKKEVQPVLPVQPVKRAHHNPQLDAYSGQERENELTQQKSSDNSTDPIIKSIQHMVTEANADLKIRGSFRHLVLSKNEGGYALDVYNCAYSNLCALEHHVPIEWSQLTTILDNLVHETGLIINSTS